MYYVVFITVGTTEEAKKIADYLVRYKLAACVNIVSNIESLYWWKNEVHHEKELLLIVKTNKEKLDELIEGVKSHHSYTVPEIIAIPIEKGFSNYLKWIDDSLKKES